MRYKITTRTQGVAGDPFSWAEDTFLMDGATVDDAIVKGRAAAVAKHPDAHIHLVYGAIPAQGEVLAREKPEPKRAARSVKGR
jgi:hypothetical protein